MDKIPKKTFIKIVDKSDGSVRGSKVLMKPMHEVMRSNLKKATIQLMKLV
jgi:hypothetical protein